MNYRLHPDAAAEHEAQFTYYEEVQAGVGRRAITSAVLATVTLLCAQPDRYPVVRPAIRLLSLKGFPFKVFYRAMAGEIQILAVAHHRRRPEYWAGRR